MELQIGRGMNPSEKILLLQANADEEEEIKYRKALSNDELEELAEESKVLLKQFFELQEEKKVYDSQKNAEIKTVRNSLKAINKNQNDEGEDIEEICFKFIAHDEGMVGWYNEDGTLVSNRKIRAAERQTSVFGQIKSLKNTGTE